MNYKEWIINRANELALDKHDTEYEYLPKSLQEVCFHMAEQDYNDRMALQNDFLYDRMEEEL